MSLTGVVHANGCPWWTQDGSNTAMIRRNAKAGGWVRVDGRDYSPACKRELA